MASMKSPVDPGMKDNVSIDERVVEEVTSVKQGAPGMVVFGGR
jgi:hypothetical protein